MVSGSHEEVSSGSPPDLRWAWVAAGVAVGVVLLGTLVPIVRHETPRLDVAILIGTLTFTLMGVLVGFNSPGETIREAAIAGLFLVVLSFLGIGIGFELPVTAALAAGALVSGLALSALGGWVGEILQGTLNHDTGAGNLEWPWILVGTVLGLMLSIYTVFVLQAVLELSPVGVLVGFLSSLFLAGFFVGFFSPGFTIMEPALAALLVVAVDILLVALGFPTPFPMGSVLMAAAAACLVGLGGGYVGESARVASSRRAAMKQAATEAEVDPAVP